MAKSHEKVWSNCLHEIRQNVNTQAFKTWFQPIKAIQLTGNALTLQVPNKFFYDWLEEHYLDLLKKVITGQLGENASLEYQIFVHDHRDIKGNTLKTIRKKDSLKKLQHILNPNGNEGEIVDLYDSQLNPAYVFDNFIVGSCNELARNAGMSIAKNPGSTAFNPLVIHGGVGLGKTHLAQAIGNEVLKLNPDKKVLYLSSNQFTNQLVQAIKSDAIFDLVNYYQLVDVLIIDDIQFLEGRETTQEIFFNLFNNLHQLDKQLIITSDRHPKDMKGIQERLISRFKWGLSADLQMPDVETRIAILEAKIQNEGIVLNNEIISFIGKNIRKSIRELEGVLVNLVAHSRLSDKEIDFELTTKVIRNFVDHINKEISIENIQKLVAEHFMLSPEQLSLKSRKREVVVARQLSMYFAKEFTTKSLKKIGESFGKDHSTVLHSCNKVKDLMDTDELFKDTVEHLKRQVELNLSLS